MSDLGASVYDAFSFLEKFLADVSRLVTTVEEKLENKKLLHIGDAAAFWDLSRAFYAPGQWLPKYIIRHYAEEIGPVAKKQWETPWLLFFAVYLYPDQFRQPVAAWGSISQNGTKNMWNILKRLEIYAQNPNFLTKVPAEEWTSLGELPSALSAFKYQSTLLTDLKDAKTVDSMVIEPLLREALEIR